VRCSSGEVVAGILELPGGDEVVDGDRCSEASPGAWSTMSIASNGEGEEWLEELRASAVSVKHRRTDSL
jgi:hypothetical protein